MKVAAIIGGALAVIVAVVMAVLAPSYFSDEADRSKMLSVADRLQPGSGWTQTENRVTGSFLCTPGDIPCNSVLRRWNPDHAPSSDELRSLIQQAGWNLEVTGDCSPPEQSTGPRELCGARGTVDSYHVRLVIVRESDTKPDFLELDMEKINN